MAKNCGCSGQTCGCLVVGGAGVAVTGVGTKAAPFTVSIDLTSLEIADRIAVNDSTTIELSMSGDGSAGNPVLLTADLVLHSPNGNRWTIAVSNAGVLSAVAL